MYSLTDIYKLLPNYEKFFLKIIHLFIQQTLIEALPFASSCNC